MNFFNFIYCIVCIYVLLCINFLIEFLLYFYDILIVFKKIIREFFKLWKKVYLYFKIY